MVERPPVKRLVVGSNPTRGASLTPSRTLEPLVYNNDKCELILAF